MAKNVDMKKKTDNLMLLKLQVGEEGYFVVKFIIEAIIREQSY